MGSIAAYITNKAVKKGQTPAEWLQSNLRNLERCRAVSHVGRYTHPDVDISLYDDSQPAGKAYLTTADTDTEADLIVKGGAAYIAIASFLVGTFSKKETAEEQKEDLTAKTAWQYFREDDPFIRREIESLGIVYEPLRQKILQIHVQALPDVTDTRLKQVYFPVGDENYHLLTILPPVSLMFAMTERIEKAVRVQRKCRDEKSESYRKPHAVFSDITRVCFGGSRPQNVSCRNSSLGVDVLPSLPPRLHDRKMRPPHEDFFFDSLYWRHFRVKLLALDALFHDPHHDLERREKREELVLDIVTMVLCKANCLRALPSGWSKDTDLGEEQAIWLDDIYLTQRLEDSEWVWPVCMAFARWLIDAHEKCCCAEKLPVISLDDAEAISFAVTMEEILKQEVREA